MKRWGEPVSVDLGGKEGGGDKNKTITLAISSYYKAEEKEGEKKKNAVLRYEF